MGEPSPAAADGKLYVDNGSGVIYDYGLADAAGGRSARFSGRRRCR